MSMVTLDTGGLISPHERKFDELEVCDLHPSAQAQVKVILHSHKELYFCYHCYHFMEQDLRCASMIIVHRS